jgi:hypothetical protein
LTLPLTDFAPRWGEIRAKSKDQAKNPSIEAGFFDGRVKTLPYSKSATNPNLGKGFTKKRGSGRMVANATKTEEAFS